MTIHAYNFDHTYLKDEKSNWRMTKDSISSFYREWTYEIFNRSIDFLIILSTEIKLINLTISFANNTLLYFYV